MTGAPSVCGVWFRRLADDATVRCSLPTGHGCAHAWKDEEENDAWPCPGCQSFGQCEPGCIDHEIRLQREHERDFYDYTDEYEETR